MADVGKPDEPKVDENATGDDEVEQVEEEVQDVMQGMSSFVIRH